MFLNGKLKRRTPFRKCVYEIQRNKVLELENATLSALLRAFFNWTVILHCMKRTQNKRKIGQWRLLGSTWWMLRENLWSLEQELGTTDLRYYLYKSQFCRKTSSFKKGLLNNLYSHNSDFVVVLWNLSCKVEMISSKTGFDQLLGVLSLPYVVSYDLF